MPDLPPRRTRSRATAQRHQPKGRPQPVTKGRHHVPRGNHRHATNSTGSVAHDEPPQLQWRYGVDGAPTPVLLQSV